MNFFSLGNEGVKSLLSFFSPNYTLVLKSLQCFGMLRASTKGTHLHPCGLKQTKRSNQALTRFPKGRHVGGHRSEEPTLNPL